eukprot:m.13448 g.13448  ORF g.13448 m.13448 type:complete len:226 (+) comp3043_c0_seq1:319-996(+)
MSKRKGDLKKKGQKYQNTVAFNPMRWGTTPQQLKIAAAPIGAVCGRCSEKLEWRKKYNKYKPLKVPGACETCKKKTVKHAYHKLCLACAEERKVCAMCKTKGEIIDLPKSREEELREAQLREVALRSLRERERRTALRKLEREAAAAKGEKLDYGSDDDAVDSEDEGSDGDGDLGAEGAPPAPAQRVAAGAAAAATAGVGATAATSGDDGVDWEADMSEDEGDHV